MAKNKKLSALEKEKALIEKIEHAKKRLSQLRKKRVMECGEMVSKYGLDALDDGILNQAFQKLSSELINGNHSKT